MFSSSGSLLKIGIFAGLVKAAGHGSMSGQSGKSIFDPAHDHWCRSAGDMEDVASARGHNWAISPSLRPTQGLMSMGRDDPRGSHARLDRPS
ncbi:MAG: hypothetical protein E8A46_00140 [Bradyrhizobium sp.]|uniref:hypothetical protein n=1 Tax=Bradyrhizobium sp. TaxID=376 RepID=UPI00120C1991|nr:hypothetical protein [Bradyrhizobium sp.]THD58342.1 MAG: hypothetical protein E8A46_00140 [Bradyrhizobium sp.]